MTNDKVRIHQRVQDVMNVDELYNYIYRYVHDNNMEQSIMALEMADLAGWQHVLWILLLPWAILSCTFLSISANIYCPALYTNDAKNTDYTAYGALSCRQPESVY